MSTVTEALRARSQELMAAAQGIERWLPAVGKARTTAEEDANAVHRFDARFARQMSVELMSLAGVIEDRKECRRSKRQRRLPDDVARWSCHQCGSRTLIARPFLTNVDMPPLQLRSWSLECGAGHVLVPQPGQVIGITYGEGK